MARPLKDGVSYFPKDTDFYTNNDKVKLIRAEFGAKGMYLLDYLLCDLYGKNGYYMKWDKSKCYLVSDGAGCGCSPNFVAEAVAGFIRCSLFDKRVFDDFGVLTSAGIQRRFMRMLSSRENFTFIQEYFLLDVTDKNDCPPGILKKCTFKKVSDKENSVIFKENPVKNTENQQSKIKENKVNKNKQQKEDAPVAVAVDLYEKNICPISPMTYEKICDWLKDVDLSLIEYAIEEAVSQNKRTWSYINAILDNQFRSGNKTRAAAEQSKKKKRTGSEDKKAFENKEFDYAALEARALGKG